VARPVLSLLAKLPLQLIVWLRIIHAISFSQYFVVRAWRVVVGTLARALEYSPLMTCSITVYCVLYNT